MTQGWRLGFLRPGSLGSVRRPALIVLVVACLASAVSAGKARAMAGTAATAEVAASEPPSGPTGTVLGASEVLLSTVTDFEIRYISADKVYLDGGRGEGLMAGDVLTIERDGVEIARLAVESVAKNSSACVLLDGVDPTAISKEDRVYGVPSGVQAAPEVIPSTSSAEDVDDTSNDDRSDASEPTKKKRTRTKIRGSVSLLWQHLEDENGDTTDRPSTRLRFDAREIGGSSWYTRVRATLRRIDRAPTSSRPDEWSDRVSALFVGYDAARVGFEVGRIPYIAAGGVGRLDGAVARVQVTPSLQLGLFGGGLPNSRTFVGSEAFQSDMTKYGIFAVHTGSPGEGWASTQTLAASNWYEGSSQARRYLASSGNLRWDGGMYLSHTIEFDRAPGIDDLGVSLGDWTLSDLRLSLRYSRAQNWSATVSHNQRSRRLTSSSTFVDTTSTGYAYRGTRASVSWTPVRGLSTRLSGSLRKADSDSLSSRSLSVGATLHRFPDRKTRLRADAQIYSTKYADGWNPRLRLERAFTRHISLGASGGARSYTAVSSKEHRENRWFRTDMSVSTAARVRFRLEYERAWGDDPDRKTILGDVSYSF